MATRTVVLWEGLITTVLGFVALYLIRNWPEKTKFLTEEERYIAIHRVQNEDEQTNEADQAEKWTDSVRGALNLPVILCTVAFAGLNSVIQARGDSELREVALKANMRPCFLCRDLQSSSRPSFGLSVDIHLYRSSYVRTPVSEVMSSPITDQYNFILLINTTSYY
jgi:hypothetical protein